MAFVYYIFFNRFLGKHGLLKTRSVVTDFHTMHYCWSFLYVQIYTYYLLTSLFNVVMFALNHNLCTLNTLYSSIVLATLFTCRASRFFCFCISDRKENIILSLYNSDNDMCPKQ